MCSPGGRGGLITPAASLLLGRKWACELPLCGGGEPRRGLFTSRCSVFGQGWLAAQQPETRVGMNQHWQGEAGSVFAGWQLRCSEGWRHYRLHLGRCSERRNGEGRQIKETEVDLQSFLTDKVGVAGCWGDLEYAVDGHRSRGLSQYMRTKKERSGKSNTRTWMFGIDNVLHSMVKYSKSVDVQFGLVYLRCKLDITCKWPPKSVSVS